MALSLYYAKWPRPYETSGENLVARAQMCKLLIPQFIEPVTGDGKWCASRSPSPIEKHNATRTTSATIHVASCILVVSASFFIGF